MGEIYLAYDPICRRNIALKRIRPELRTKESLRRRFLREAWITSQLSHPGVIPIYTIHAEKEELYYTMPYVEGETLSEILRRARRDLKEGRPSTPENSIRGLMRPFLAICQTIAYAHSRSIIHRDLKPDNVIIGKYGEVSILDWGLSRWTFEEEEIPLEEYGEVTHLTTPGRIFGTLSHLAPECCLGEPANRRSEIFSLGVILYQLLTLTLPFARPSLKEIAEAVQKEKFVDPLKVAPYRDVPMALARVAERCLQRSPEERYSTVDDLIRDIRAYLLGQSDWFEVAQLKVDDASHWEMAEYIFMPQKLAVTGHAEGNEWAKVMISRDSFSGNCRITCRLRIHKKGEGLGLLVSIGEKGVRRKENRGLCMWLGADPKEGSKLFRSGTEVSAIPDLHLETGRWYSVDLRKEQSNLYLYLDGQLAYTYLNYLPLMGTHVGLLFRDGNFDLEEVRVAVGNLSLKVDCLAIPDAFLEAEMYDRALSEYRRISTSFPDRTEGKQAQFRSGITLLERGRATEEKEAATLLFEEALQEFEKLHKGAAAPLEYLGKSLVYLAMGDESDEVNSLELAVRRYPHHPMISAVREHIRVRLFETSRFHRKLAYSYALLIAHQLPDLLLMPDTATHMVNLQSHWEPLPFLLPIPASEQSAEADRLILATPLAFWLGKPYILAELLDQALKLPTPSFTIIANLIHSLIELGSYQLAEKKLNEIEASELDLPREGLALLHIPILSYQETPQFAAKELFTHRRNWSSPLYLRIALFLMDRAITLQQPELVQFIVDSLPSDLIESPHEQVALDARRIWAYLLSGELAGAAALFSRYPLELIDEETTLLRSLFGCWLAMTEGVELARVHFAGVLERRHPRSCSLLSHFLIRRGSTNEEWEQEAFLWERRWLYRQLILYHHCTGDQEQESHFRNLERKEYLNVSE